MTTIKLLKDNKYYAIAILLYLTAILLQRFTSLQFTPPCLIKYFSGVACPACGSTRALEALMGGDYSNAWHYNPLIFVVLPILMLLIAIKWRTYYKHITKK